MTNSSDKNRVCAVVPFYNEQKHIKPLFTQLLTMVDAIIAVDDGSSDDSSNEIPKSNKIYLVTHDVNSGKGAALKTGFRKSIELGFDFTFTIDADQQHDPNSIRLFLDNIDNNDIIIGNRLNNLSGMPLHRILSNKITSWIMTIKTGALIKDSQCGFRLFRTNILERLVFESDGFESETEILISAAKQKMRIGFVDIPTIYGDQVSKMTNWKTTIGFVRIILTK